MSITFVRMIDGRLWHVAADLLSWKTVCGRETFAFGSYAGGPVPEQLAGHVPDGAWVCERCVKELACDAITARRMLRNDPRRRPNPEPKLVEET